MYRFRKRKKKKRKLSPECNCLPVEEAKQQQGGSEREEEKEIVEMHEIGEDSGRDEFPDNIQPIHSSM